MANSRRDPESSHDHELVTEDELFQDDSPSLLVESEEREPPRVSRIDELRRNRAVVRPGDLLAGKYRVERVHAPGALGVTCDAQHVQLGQRVALKLFAAELGADSVGSARFLNSARLAAQLRGEHLARVLDLGTLDSGAAYCVTEHLSGTDLRGVLRVREWLPVSEAVDYALQVCEGLAAAHAAGLAHRNLKPANVFLAREYDGRPSIKLLDFCLVEGLLNSAPVMLSTGSSATSSLAYLAPEQIRAPGSVDLRADIWALGALLHEWLSGSPVFSAVSVPGIFAAIAADPVTPLRQLNADVPAELEEVVRRCLEKERDYRWSDVGTLARQLRPFASESGKEVVDRVVMVLERRVRHSRSMIPPALPSGTPRVLAPAAPVLAPVSYEPAPSRRTLEMGLAVLAVVGCSVGISAFVTIHNLRSVLASRAQSERVVASLSPALTAEATRAPSPRIEPVAPVVASSVASAAPAAAPPLKPAPRPALRPLAAAPGIVAPAREPARVADQKPAPAPPPLFDQPN